VGGEVRKWGVGGGGGGGEDQIRLARIRRYFIDIPDIGGNWGSTVFFPCAIFSISHAILLFNTIANFSILVNLFFY